jgi:hypothetical protein
MNTSKFLFLSIIVHIIPLGIYAQKTTSQKSLGPRSGYTELRVWDRKTKHFIYAGLGIYPVKVRPNPFAAMSTATGDDGASHTLTLPEGTYLAKVERYLCNGKKYFSAKPPSVSFTVKAGRRQRKTLSVDVSKMRAESSYDNPGGERCSK